MGHTVTMDTQDTMATTPMAMAMAGMEGRGDLLSLLLNPLLIHLLILLLTHGIIILIMGMDTHMLPTIILMLTGEERGDLLNPLLILMLTQMLTHGFIILGITDMDTPTTAMDTPTMDPLESKQVPILNFQHIMDRDTAQ